MAKKRKNGMEEKQNGNQNIPVTPPHPNSGAIGARGQYDAVAPDASKKRRAPKVETAGETGLGSRQLPPMTRLMMISLVRDAARNFSSSRAILKQLGLNVVGTEYKLRIKLDHDPKDKKDPVTAAQDWFNKVWAKNCDFRSGLHLFDINRLLVQSVARDGDCGLLFDRDLMKTGRLVAWESDQICTPNPLPKGITNCNDGVLLDTFGREVGYCVHNGYGKGTVELKDAHIFPRDPEDESNNMFRLFRVPWRFNQYRGTSDQFSCVADLLDVYEMRAKELQSAKVAASMAGVIKKKDVSGLPPLSNPLLDPHNLINEMMPEAAPAQPRPEEKYENLEALTGGNFEYLAPDDIFEMITSNRPCLNGIPFAEHIIKSAGWAGGMARCYASGEAQASYTAFRGEMIMTWVMFKYWQKWLERYAQDWQAERAINWAVQNGKLKALDPDFIHRLAWQHPKMPSVNPLIDQQTFLAALKNGATNLEEELGPAWREVVDELIEEIEILRKNNVPHAIFETKSGGVQEPSQSEKSCLTAKDTKEKNTKGAKTRVNDNPVASLAKPFATLAVKEKGEDK